MIHHGDLFDVLPTLAEASIDACVTDPPYGIGFMGKEWDSFSPMTAQRKAGLRQCGKLPRNKQANPNLRGRTVNGVVSTSQIEYDYSVNGMREFQEWTSRWACEVFRVLKPGAYILVCSAPRSYHRMACGLEDAGFVIRDKFSWLFGSGFPKNYNLGDGKGTALKPAHEPIALAWKPFKGSIKACHAQHGTAALNINDCRIGEGKRVPSSLPKRGNEHGVDTCYGSYGPREFKDGQNPEIGRWPSNVLLDEEAAALLDEQTGDLQSGDAHVLRRGATTGRGMGYGSSAAGNVLNATYGDCGGASRFYYVAKPSREERDRGIYDLPERSGGEATDRKDGSAGLNNPRAGAGRTGGARNIHPTVKPVELMRWLVRLVTPEGGTVLDPFTGSGTTGMACRYELRQFIGIEREAEYVAIAERRIGAIAPLFEDTADAAAG